LINYYSAEHIIFHYIKKMCTREQALNILEYNRRDLHAKSNVTGTGLSISNGKYCAKVYLLKKVPLDMLDEKDRIPSILYNESHDLQMETDIHVSGVISAC
jgi:hypothetical protein